MPFWAKRSAFAKIVIILAIAFLAGAGLCGVDAAFLTGLRDHRQEFGPNSFVGGIGALTIVLSALGLVVTVLVWVIVAIMDWFRHRGSEPQQLLDDKEKDR